jgi:alpha-galactosidase
MKEFLGGFRSVLWRFICLAALAGLDRSAFAVNADPELAFNRQWAERAFGGSVQTPLPDHSLRIVREDGRGDTKLGRCAAGGPLRLGSKTYSRGIGVNSYSVLRVSLGQPAARFRAIIGLDRNVDNTPASVSFHVAVDGKDVFTSGVIRASGEVQAIDLPLTGSREFDLVVDEGGDGRAFDQADWADARVVLEDGSELWLDDLARNPLVAGQIPFSFVYGGRSSDEFLGRWPRRIQDQPPEAAAQQRQRILTLTDPETGLEVRAVATIYTDTPGVDWTVHFTNKGTRDTPVLEQVKAVDVTVHPGISERPAVLHRLRPDAENWLPLDQPLSSGKQIEFAPVGGRSSLGACPFFNLGWDGGGVVTAIGWTGQWVASTAHTNGNLRLTAGMQNLRLKLHPGESIRSPRILQLYWFGEDRYRPYNLFRQTMLKHVVPRLDGQPVTPPIAHLSTAFYEMDKGTQRDVLSHLAAIQGLGFEYFWLDAYYGKNDFPTVGNYVFPLLRGFNQERFPGGIKPVGDAVRRAGMKFLMWFEPERICPGTLIAQEHPDWVVLPPDGGWGMFNLAVPQARQHITDYLNASAKEYGISCVRIDNAVVYNGLWESLDRESPDRRGLAEIRYVEGLYRMWDDLRAANPGLFIDNCASGGGRIDLETCSRSIPLWRTDGTIAPLMAGDFLQAAAQNQAMTAALSRYVPFSVSGQMGATPYLFRSGVNGGGISFAEDVRPASYPRDLLKQAIAEAKRLRKYYLGDHYPLTDVTTEARDWCVIQYHRPTEQDGMVILFRRPKSSFASYVLREAQGIEPEAEYEVTQSRCYEPSKPERMKGDALQRLKVDVDACPGSVVVEYRNVIR